MKARSRNISVVLILANTAVIIVLGFLLSTESNKTPDIQLLRNVSEEKSKMLLNGFKSQNCGSLDGNELEEQVEKCVLRIEQSLEQETNEMLSNRKFLDLYCLQLDNFQIDDKKERYSNYAHMQKEALKNWGAYDQIKKRTDKNSIGLINANRFAFLLNFYHHQNFSLRCGPEGLEIWLSGLQDQYAKGDSIHLETYWMRYPDFSSCLIQSLQIQDSVYYPVGLNPIKPKHKVYGEPGRNVVPVRAVFNALKGQKVIDKNYIVYLL